MSKAVLALGSNISPAKEHIDAAIHALARLGTVKEVAPYIVSKPEGYANQADFVNTVLVLSTPYKPLDLLRKLKALETELGRVPSFTNGPRLIDMDILFYDDIEFFDDSAPLIIPHPRLHEREFVLKPLSYILPEYVHPKLNQKVYELYRALMKRKGAPECHIL